MEDHWELLCADNLVLIAETEDEIRRKLQARKEDLERKGMKVNMAKTKVMVCGQGHQRSQVSGKVKWPCGVCDAGVGKNSLLCVGCNKWVHKRCSGLKGKLDNFKDTFKCRRCVGGEERPNKDEVQDGNLVIGDGEVLEKVEKFCYLGDVLDREGGSFQATVERVRKGWNSFRKSMTFLMHKGIALKLKGKLYDACVRSSVLYGSETWALRKGDELKLERNDMRND